MDNLLDMPVMAAGTEDDMSTSSCFPSAQDAELPRGRKRLRLGSDEFELAGTNNSTRRKQTPSGESATLRGRCRHRSTSVTGRSSRSRSFVRDREDGKHHHHILRLVQLNGGGGSGGGRRGRRRSQSPSRSYSHTRDGSSRLVTGPRRRQRTRSRSRDHFFRDHHHVSRMNSSLDLKSPLCLEMMVGDSGGVCSAQSHEALED